VPTDARPGSPGPPPRAASERAGALGRVLAVLVVGLAVAVDRDGWTPFGPARWLVATTLGAAAIALAARRTAQRVDRATAVAGVALVGWSALAAAFGVDPLLAWIGTPERHLGVLTWVLFGGLFVAGQRTTPAERRLVLRAVVVALAAVDAYAVAEWAGHAPVDVASSTDRFGGPYGSPALLGAAVVLAAPVAVGLATDRDERPGWRGAAAAVAGGALVPLLGSGSRAALVGLAGGGVLAVAALVRSGSGLRRRAVLTGSVGVVAVAILVAVTPVGDRIAATVDPDRGEARSRVDEWRTGLAALRDHPLLGVGPEGYRIVFPEVVDDAYVREHGRATVTDRAHAGVLDVAITGGVPAALAYAALCGLVVVRARRAIRAGDAALAGVAVGVLAALVHQQLLFPLAEVDPVLWLLAGFLVATTSTAGRATVRAPAPAAERVGAAVAVVAAGVAAVALVAGILDVAADRRALTALERSAQGDDRGALAAADDAAALRPDSMRYALVAAVVAAEPGTLPALVTAESRVDDALARSPDDPVLRATRADVLGRRGLLTRDPADLARGRAAWDDVVASDPRHPAHRVALAQVAVAQGDLAAARAATEQAADLAPGDAGPWSSLARALLDAGELAEARVAAETAVATDPADDGARAVRDEVVRATRDQAAERGGAPQGSDASEQVTGTG
jgi:O-antigen ligase